MSDLLGLPLEEALARLAARGETATVVQTSAPRPRLGGTLRVVRVREGELTVSAFMDDTPNEERRMRGFRWSLRICH